MQNLVLVCAIKKKTKIRQSLQRFRDSLWQWSQHPNLGTTIVVTENLNSRTEQVIAIVRAHQNSWGHMCHPLLERRPRENPDDLWCAMRSVMSVIELESLRQYETVVFILDSELLVTLFRELTNLSVGQHQVLESCEAVIIDKTNSTRFTEYRIP